MSGQGEAGPWLKLVNGRWRSPDGDPWLCDDLGDYFTIPAEAVAIRVVSFPGPSNDRLRVQLRDEGISLWVSVGDGYPASYVLRMFADFVLHQSRNGCDYFGLETKDQSGRVTYFLPLAPREEIRP